MLRRTSYRFSFLAKFCERVKGVLSVWEWAAIDNVLLTVEVNSSIFDKAIIREDSCGEYFTGRL